MGKDTFYFSHDYNARNDIKIKKLISKHNLLGYGIFWAIVEDLYNNTNVLPIDYDTISFDLRCDKSVLISVINDFDLFVFTGETFGSLSVQKRLDERTEKSEKASKSIKFRWQKLKNDTNVLLPNNDSNTIKERKGKEKKEESKISTAEGERIKKLTEMFTRVRIWKGDSLSIEVGKFINKYPTIEINKAAGLVNAWAANYQPHPFENGKPGTFDSSGKFIPPHGNGFMPM